MECTFDTLFSFRSASEGYFEIVCRIASLSRPTDSPKRPKARSHGYVVRTPWQARRQRGFMCVRRALSGYIDTASDQYVSNIKVVISHSLLFCLYFASRSSPTAPSSSSSLGGIPALSMPPR